MSNLSPRHVKWFALLLTLSLIPDYIPFFGIRQSTAEYASFEDVHITSCGLEFTRPGDRGSGFNTLAATGCQWCHYGPYVWRLGIAL